MMALCAALFLGSCSGPDKSEQARPALWLVADEDTHIYLLGSMHALPSKMEWRGGAVADAISKSDTLILEMAPSQSPKAGEVFAALAPRTSPLPVKQRLNQAALAGYDKLGMTDRLALPDTLDDWALMLILGQRAAKDANLSPSYGVETQLTAIFTAADKAIHGLETAQAQLMIFENLDAKTQRSLLNNAFAKSDTAAAGIKELLRAWAKGDVAGLEKRINEDIVATSDAYKMLISDRNRRWAAWATQRMDQPGEVLIAVGAGHMVGEDGLPALLAAKGLTVTRLQ